METTGGLSSAQLLREVKALERVMAEEAGVDWYESHGVDEEGYAVIGDTSAFDAATAAVEALATEVATLMAALKAPITTLANVVAKIAKRTKS